MNYPLVEWQIKNAGRPAINLCEGTIIFTYLKTEQFEIEQLPVINRRIKEIKTNLRFVDTPANLYLKFSKG
jgi:hypothetical protein